LAGLLLALFPGENSADKDNSEKHQDKQ